MDFSAEQLCPHHNQPTARQIFYESKRTKRFCLFCQIGMGPFNEFCRAKDSSPQATSLWERRYKLSLDYAKGTYTHDSTSKFPQMTVMVAHNEAGVKGPSRKAIVAKITTQDAEFLVGKTKLTKKPVDHFYLAMNANGSYVFAIGAEARVPRPHLLRLDQEGKWTSIPYITHGWKVK